MTKPSWPLVVFLLLVIFAGGFFLFRKIHGAQPNWQPSEALGEILAGEILRGAESSTKIVIMSVSPATEETAAGIQLASFQTALKRHKNIQLLATEVLESKRGGLDNIMSRGQISLEQLNACISQHGNARVLVFFGGFPRFPDAALNQIARGKVKIFAVTSAGPAVRRALELNALALAVVPRLGNSPLPEGTPKTARDWFDREYQIVTPAAAGELLKY